MTCLGWNACFRVFSWLWSSILRNIGGFLPRRFRFGFWHFIHSSTEYFQYFCFKSCGYTSDEVDSMLYLFRFFFHPTFLFPFLACHYRTINMAKARPQSWTPPPPPPCALAVHLYYSRSSNTSHLGQYHNTLMCLKAAGISADVIYDSQEAVAATRSFSAVR